MLFFLSNFRFVSLIECHDCKGKTCFHVKFNIWRNALEYLKNIHCIAMEMISGNLSTLQIVEWRKYAQEAFKAFKCCIEINFSFECDDETIIVYSVCTISYSVHFQKNWLISNECLCLWGSRLQGSGVYFLFSPIWGRQVKRIQFCSYLASFTTTNSLIRIMVYSLVSTFRGAICMNSHHHLFVFIVFRFVFC